MDLVVVAVSICLSCLGRSSEATLEKSTTISPALPLMMDDCSCSTGDEPLIDLRPESKSIMNHSAKRHKITCKRLTTIANLSNFCHSEPGTDFLHVVNVKTDPASLSELVDRLKVSRLKLTNSIVNFFDGDSTFPVKVKVSFLDVSHNRMTSLGDVQDLLDGVDRVLAVFDLSSNQMSTIDGRLDGLMDLQNLHARNNRIDSINETTFSRLANLRYLNLENNRISRVHRRAFKFLRKLSSLILANNPLYHFDEVEISSRFLSFLDLTGCLLTRIPRPPFHSVRYLQLKNNRIQHLYEGDVRIAEVVILVLDNNLVVSFSAGFFSGLHKLRQLWLNGNSLISIPVNIPVQLQKLFLDDNSIDSIVKDCFPNESELVALSLSGNHITRFEESAFERLDKLEHLDLSSNKIKYLRKSHFNGLESLHTLHLSNNPLLEMDSDLFSHAVKLKSLSISNMVKNPDFKNADLFKDLNNLEFLDIENSPLFIEYFLKSGLFSSDTKLLQVLNIANSELKTASFDFLRKLSSIENVKISSNSWVCDASILHFKTWLMSDAGRFSTTNRNSNKCSTPPELEDRPIVSLTMADLSTQRNHPKSSDDLHPRSTNIERDGRPLIGAKNDPKTWTNNRESGVDLAHDGFHASSFLHKLNSTSHKVDSSFKVNFIVAALISSTSLLCILTAFVLGLQVASSKRSASNSERNWFNDKESALLSASLSRNRFILSSSLNLETKCNDSPTDSLWKKYRWNEV